MELGKITLLTGPNNTGKSSIIYGLLALKNVIINPNQSLDSFLNFIFLNLGGFGQAVYLKNETLNIKLGIEVDEERINSEFIASFGKKKSDLSLKTSKPYSILLNLDVTFPYPGNRTTSAQVTGPFGKAQIVWNGISPTVSVIPQASELEKIAKDGKSSTGEDIGDILEELNKSISAPGDELRAVDFIPLGRGFTRQSYSSVPMQQQLFKEDELATLLASNRELEAKVAHYLEPMVNRVFNVRSILGTANFYLQSRDRSTGFVCDLVNEGFGTNQLVTILTKSLREEMRTICIEESEIHLHPELMDKLVDIFVRISQDENKSFIISTHSEHIVLSLLNKVANKRLKAEDVRIYYLTKKGRDTVIEKQEINDKGQVKGGLKGFYEAELKQVKEFFSIS
jgi:predicted ATPase